MKKYRKLERDLLADYVNYKSFDRKTEGDDSELFTVSSILEEYDSDLLLNFLNDSKWESQQSQECFIIKDCEMAELYNTFDTCCVEDDEEITPSAIISIENLKQLALDWRVLMNKKALEIYFIRNDDGSIIVRESLEEE